MRRIIWILLIMLSLSCIDRDASDANLPEYNLSYSTKEDMVLEMDGVKYCVRNDRKWYPIEMYEDEPIGKCMYYEWKTYIYKTSSPDCVEIMSSKKNRPPNKCLFRIDIDVFNIEFDEIDEALFRRHSDKKEILIDFNEVRTLWEGAKTVKKIRLFDSEWVAEIAMRSEEKKGLETRILICYDKVNEQYYFKSNTLPDNYFEGIPCNDFYNQYSAQLECMP